MFNHQISAQTCTQIMKNAKQEGLQKHVCAKYVGLFDLFFDWLEDRFFNDFWSMLGPTWPPKPHQNRLKFYEKCIEKLH